MSWHIYPYGLGQKRKGNALPDALAVFVYDEAETPRAVAEAWAKRFPDSQISFLTVDIGLPVPDQLEKLATLINWELAWTGLWYHEHLILVGIGRGVHMARCLAAKCGDCGGVLGVGAASGAESAIAGLAGNDLSDFVPAGAGSRYAA